ncbi:sensor histidine kinase [Winogradskyella sp. PG-2]|uniref:sensor histidine kinase n=1 Tax=Winogradskyella sp. PG-2 TaxID=754409 RepID=UPI000458924A|nr:ATP-binding protein [Winogradskyella sp. PG-2]BAO75959.1 two-component sensor histidine kinase [Winogradskyella sp. PG-2]
MKLENNILEILPLYEYAMAIGKSVDYKESCDLFLKLILRRKNLNAAWILERKDNQLRSTYSIPLGKKVTIVSDKNINKLIESVKDHKLTEVDASISELVPIDINTGYLAIFNLKEQGYLFLYSKLERLKQKDLLQLQPVINKFLISLKACKAFKRQQILLNNLELRNQELSDYAHMVSHDLKSPLRSIDTLIAWLKDDYIDKLDDQGQQSLNLIRNSVEKMDTLINGILEYSTIGKSTIEVYDVDLDNLVDDILDIIYIPDTIEIRKEKLPLIKGDKYRLQQLFQNLISNSITYNDKEYGIVEIGVIDKNDFWEFYIKDNGKGIEEVYFKKIFETFQRLESNQDSTGIGLSIVKKIVDLYGGDIWLTSELKKGTTFFFTLKNNYNGTA